MQHTSDNAEITHLKMHLLSALNGCVINRYLYNDNGTRGELSQRVEVPIKYGHKTRQIHEAIQVSGHITLPIISVSLGGISIDTNRNESKNHELFNHEYVTEEGIRRYLRPTPINLSFNIKIATKTGSDFEAIIAHYLSVFNPYIQVSWREPHSNKEIISKVEWDGSVGLEFPDSVASTEKIRYIGNMSVNMEGWIFRDVANPAEIIRCISYDIDVIPNSDCHNTTTPEGNMGISNTTGGNIRRVGIGDATNSKPNVIIDDGECCSELNLIEW